MKKILSLVLSFTIVFSCLPLQIFSYADDNLAQAQSSDISNNVTEESNQTNSAEEQNTSAEQQDTSTEQQNTSAEEQDTSTEEQDTSTEQNTSTDDKTNNDGKENIENQSQSEDKNSKEEKADIEQEKNSANTKGGGASNPIADLAPGRYLVSIDEESYDHTLVNWQDVNQTILNRNLMYVDIYTDDEGNKKQRAYFRFFLSNDKKCTLHDMKEVEKGMNFFESKNIKVCDEAVSGKIDYIVDTTSGISINPSTQKKEASIMEYMYIDFDVPDTGLFDLEFDYAYWDQYANNYQGALIEEKKSLKNLKFNNYKKVEKSGDFINDAFFGKETKEINLEGISYYMGKDNYNNDYVTISPQGEYDGGMLTYNIEPDSQKFKFLRTFYTYDLDAGETEEEIKNWETSLRQRLEFYADSNKTFDKYNALDLSKAVKNGRFQLKIAYYSELEDRVSNVVKIDLPFILGARDSIKSDDEKVEFFSQNNYIIPKDAKIVLKDLTESEIESYKDKIDGEFFDVRGAELNLLDSQNKEVNLYTPSGKIYYEDAGENKLLFYTLNFSDLNSQEPVYEEIYKVLANGDLMNLNYLTSEKSKAGDNLGKNNKAIINTFYANNPHHSNAFFYEDGDEIKTNIDRLKQRYHNFVTNNADNIAKFEQTDFKGKYIFVKRPIYNIDEKRPFASAKGFRYMRYSVHNDTVNLRVSGKGSDSSKHFYVPHYYEEGKIYELVNSLIESGTKDYTQNIGDYSFIEKLYLKAENIENKKYKVYIDLKSNAGNYMSDIKVGGKAAEIMLIYKDKEKTYPKRIAFDLDDLSAYQNISYKINSAGDEKTATLALHYLKKMPLDDINLDQVPAPLIKTKDGSLQYENAAEASVSIENYKQGARVYYTTDGTKPTSGSNEYTGDFVLKASGANAKTYTIRAIAIHEGIQSEISELKVKFRAEGLYAQDTKEPVIKIRPTNTTEDSLAYKFSIKAEDGADIYYTKDGTNPEIKEDHKYNGESIEGTVSKTGKNYIKAIAVVSGKNPSMQSERIVKYTKKWYEFIGEGEKLLVKDEMINMAEPNLYSMGNNALTHDAWLFKKDGKYWLEIEFQALDMGSILAYLNKFWYYEDRKDGYDTSVEKHIPAENIEYFKDTSENDNIKKGTILVNEIDDGNGGKKLDHAVPIKLFTRVAPDEMGSPRAIIAIDYSKAYKEITGDTMEVEGKLATPIISATQNAQGNKFDIDIKNPAIGNIGDKIYYQYSFDYDFNPNISDLEKDENLYKNKFSVEKKDKDILVICAFSKKDSKYSMIERRILQFSENSGASTDDPVNPEETKKYYKVPATMKKYHENAYSMADTAMDDYVYVHEDDGTYTYYVSFSPIKRDWGGQTLEGKLTNLFIWPGGANGSKQETYDLGGGKRSFTLSSKENEVLVSVWVDAMDAIAGGGEGSGEQKARLVLDWSGAETIDSDETGESYDYSDSFEGLDPDDKDKKKENKKDSENKSEESQKIPELEVVKTFSEVTFSDVSEEKWYAESVEYVYERDLMVGVSENNFGAETKTTRAMLSTILHRLDGNTKVDLAVPFSDIENGAWYMEGVKWAADSKLISGFEDGTFKPNDELTREQMVTILYRYSLLKNFDVSKKADLSSFNDANEVSDWSREAMAWAVENKIIQGVTDTQISAKGVTTRAQMAAIIERYLKKYVDKK